MADFSQNRSRITTFHILDQDRRHLKTQLKLYSKWKKTVLVIPTLATEFTDPENRPIFENDADRDDFVARLSRILTASATPCYAWALIPNHFHLLLQTGETPVSTVMRRLLTGYAVSFNRRHHRCGRLFQNRFKSILCQQDPYLRELVRYIHLNPLRAKLVVQ